MKGDWVDRTYKHSFMWSNALCWIGLILPLAGLVLTIATFFVWHWLALLWLLSIPVGLVIIYVGICIGLAKEEEILRELEVL